MPATTQSPVDLLEIVSIQDIDRPRRFTRAWSGDDVRPTSGFGTSGLATPTVVMTQYPSEAAHRAYWETGELPIGVSSVDTCQEAVRIDPCGWVHMFSDGMALPGATFGVRFRCTGLMQDQCAAVDTDFRLDDGEVRRVVAGEEFRPDLELSGAFTDLVRWTAGVADFAEVSERVEVAGSVYLLASLTGVFQMFKGLRCPTGLVDGASALVDLVDRHRRYRGR